MIVRCVAEPSVTGGSGLINFGGSGSDTSSRLRLRVCIKCRKDKKISCISGSRHDPIPHGVAHHDPGCLFETIRTRQTTQHRRTIIALTKMSICLSRYALCMHDIDPHNEYEFGKQQSNYTFAKLFKTTICKDDKSFFN